jgi:hypothetical protein
LVSIQVSALIGSRFNNLKRQIIVNETYYEVEIVCNHMVYNNPSRMRDLGDDIRNKTGWILSNVTSSSLFFTSGTKCGDHTRKLYIALARHVYIILSKDDVSSAYDTDANPEGVKKLILRL